MYHLSKVDVSTSVAGKNGIVKQIPMRRYHTQLVVLTSWDMELGKEPSIGGSSVTGGCGGDRSKSASGMALGELLNISAKWSWLEPRSRCSINSSSVILRLWRIRESLFDSALDLRNIRMSSLNWGISRSILVASSSPEDRTSSLWMMVLSDSSAVEIWRECRKCSFFITHENKTSF